MAKRCAYRVEVVKYHDNGDSEEVLVRHIWTEFGTESIIDLIDDALDYITGIMQVFVNEGYSR